MPARGVALPDEALVAGQVERQREGRRIVAAVVDEARRGGKRIVVARDQVPPADLGGIEAEPVRAEIERALHHEHAHGHADAAIRAERRLVRGDGQDVVRIRGRAVRARQDCRGAHGLERGRERVDVLRPGIGPDARAEAEQDAPRVGGGLDLHARLARLGRRGEVLAPRLRPLDGPVDQTGRGGHGEVLGHHVHLLAEPAARIGHDDAHLPLGESEGLGERGAHDVRHLRARPDREGLALPARDHAAGLERGGGEARVTEGLPDHDRGGGERALDVAVAVTALEEHVPLVVGVQPIGVLGERGVDRGDRGE